ncbi:MAG: diacylglycerol kinase family lipid kinase [Clostridia bacterium]|nr:diacylglycerol kinase family lipid kinase [Clostridia bacterium]
MKHLFVVNPKAGKGKAYSILRPLLKQSVEKYDVDYEVYVTKSRDDMAEYCKKYLETGEKVRFYACGGDGTIYDLVNIIYGYKNVEFAVVPLGSGNDFIRIFGSREDFLDIEAQLNGTPIKIDAIKCGDRIAVNQCSMGMDAEICAKQSDFKKIPLLRGDRAYTAALAYCAMVNRVNKFTITIDDNRPISGEFLFTVCGNSRYYGGGYQATPYALPDDGLLDFSIIDTLSLPDMLMKVGGYKKGKHYNWKQTLYVRGKKMTVHSDEPAAINIDGEVDIVNDCTFEILPEEFTFVVPATSDYVEDRKSGKLTNEIGLKI